MPEPHILSLSSNVSTLGLNPGCHILCFFSGSLSVSLSLSLSLSLSISVSLCLSVSLCICLFLSCQSFFLSLSLTHMHTHHSSMNSRNQTQNNNSSSRSHTQVRANNSQTLLHTHSRHDFGNDGGEIFGMTYLTQRHWQDLFALLSQINNNIDPYIENKPNDTSTFRGTSKATFIKKMNPFAARSTTASSSCWPNKHSETMDKNVTKRSRASYEVVTAFP